MVASKYTKKYINKYNTTKKKVFSATAGNFNVNFYIFTRRSYLYITAKWLSTVFKYNEVIDIFRRPLRDFRALKSLGRNTAKQRH